MHNERKITRSLYIRTGDTAVGVLKLSTEMRMVRWMCDVKLKDRLTSKELRERLGIDDIALVLQQKRRRWYGHVLRRMMTIG